MADVKDLKIDGTKYNIKIPSANVKLMTGYSKGSSANAITPSDSLNSAIGKLEYKADTNKTNILYAINNGVKNELVIEEVQATSYVQGVTFTWNDDQSITVNAPSTHGAVWIYINQEHRADMINKFRNRAMVISGMPANSPVELGVFHYDGTNTAVGDGTSNGEFTLTVNDPTSFAVQIYVPQNVAASNVVIKPMICTKEAWDQSHDYQPPALQNSDLTYLEAEDRAALAEEIDAGAKNKLKNNSYTCTGSEGRYGRDDTLSIPAGDYVLIAKVNQTAGSAFTLVWNGTQHDFHVGGAISNTVRTWDVHATSTITSAWVYFNMKNDSWTDVMLCTKAAFGVSQKFVPYRPDYDLILSTLKENSVYSVASATAQATTYSCDTTEWTNGVYLFTVLGVVSNSNRCCSSYMAYISNSGNPAFTVVAETAGSKIIDFTRTSSNRVFTITCDTNACHVITARRI